MRRMMMAWMAVCAMAAALPAQPVPQWMYLAGTTNNNFKIGPGLSVASVTLTNSSGNLSLSGGLTTNGTVSLGTSVGAFTTTGVITSSVSTGTAPLAIASTTKVSNLNVDQVDGISLTSDTLGGIVYQTGAAGFAAMNSGGTSGQFLKSTGGSTAPAWVGLNSGQVWVGNGSNIPTAVTPSGDVTINTSGVTAIGSDKITNSMIVDGTIGGNDIATGAITSTNIFNGTIVAADIASGTITSTEIQNGTVHPDDLNSTLEERIPIASSSAGVEVSNTIRVTIQLHKVDNSAVLNERVMVFITIADSSQEMGTVTSASVTVAPVSGSVFDTITANKKYIWQANSNGTVAFDLTLVAATTVYVNYNIGAKTYSQTLVFALIP